MLRLRRKGQGNKAFVVEFWNIQSSPSHSKRHLGITPKSSRAKQRTTNPDSQGGRSLRDGGRRRGLRPGLAADGVQLGQDAGGLCHRPPCRHGCTGVRGPCYHVSHLFHVCSRRGRIYEIGVIDEDVSRNKDAETFRGIYARNTNSQ